jgi:4,5-DOPA dioxygenase extradiol
MSKMPVIFIGHGSPMNAIEHNSYTNNWLKIAQELPKPKAILVISAHWYTKDTRIMDDLHPKTIYDMYGFPKELYEIEYKATGAPELAHFTKSLIGKDTIVDNSWGYDHGAWSVLHVMYPNADIPVFQLSVNKNAAAAEHYELGKKLASLRNKDVLILASGNVVHNLSRVDFSMEGGYEWANEFDNYIKENILSQNHQAIINYEKAGDIARLSFSIPDHFYPLLYVLGASASEDKITVYNDSCVAGSLSMTCYKWDF